MAHDIEESKSAIISSLTRVKRASFCTGAVASVGDDSGVAAPCATAAAAEAAVVPENQ